MPEELNFGYFRLLVLYLESYVCLCSFLGKLIIFDCLINDQLPILTHEIVIHFYGDDLTKNTKIRIDYIFTSS